MSISAIPRYAHRHSGVSLIEMVISIVIVSIGLMSMLSAINSMLRNSVDPMIELQAISIANGYLDDLSHRDSHAIRSAQWADLQKNESEHPIIQLAAERKFQIDRVVLPGKVFNAPENILMEIKVIVSHYLIPEGIQFVAYKPYYKVGPNFEHIQMNEAEYRVQG